MESIFHRISVRKFLDKPVTDQQIEKMLRAAMAAPSAKNQQPWEYYAVTNKELIGQLAACSPYATCCKDAPLAFVACTRKNCPMPDYAYIDTSASVENLLLEADALGLGAVWLGIAPHPERVKAMGDVLALPENLEAFALIACGHPAESRPQQDRYDLTRVHICR